MRLWCPEIAHLPTQFLIDPKLITEAARAKFSIDISKYPNPCVELLHREFKKPNLKTSSKNMDKKYKSHGGVPGLF